MNSQLGERRIKLGLIANPAQAAELANEKLMHGLGH
jgi:hypothetical protein